MENGPNAQNRKKKGKSVGKLPRSEMGKKWLKPSEKNGKLARFSTFGPCYFPDFRPRTTFAIRAAIMIYRSLRPFGPEVAKMSQKGSFRGSAEKSQKIPKKSKNTDFRTILGIYIFRLFRVFFGTFLQTPEKTLFETFLRVRARRARRLL